MSKQEQWILIGLVLAVIGYTHWRKSSLAAHALVTLTGSATVTRGQSVDIIRQIDILPQSSTGSASATVERGSSAPGCDDCGSKSATAPIYDDDSTGLRAWAN